MRTSSISSLSVAGTPGRERHSRSHLRAPGLAVQVRQILRLELRRGRDRRSRSRSRSSSGGLRDSESSHRSERSQASVSHRRSRRTRSSHSDRYRCSPRHHSQRFHSYRGVTARARPRDRAISRSPLHLERSRPLSRPPCIISVAPATPPGAVQATSFSAPVLSSPPRHALRMLVPLTGVPPSLLSTRSAPTQTGALSPGGRQCQRPSGPLLRLSRLLPCPGYQPVLVFHLLSCF